MNSRIRIWTRRSSTLRLSLLYLALLLVAVTTLFAFFFLSTTEILERQTNAAIDSEIASVRERFRQGGLPGLTVLITNRAARREAGESLYLLTDDRYRPQAGNLRTWPEELLPETTAGGQWQEFDVAVSAGAAEAVHRVRARTFSLREDFKLLVTRDFHLLIGRDIQDLVDVRRQMLRTFGWGLALTVVLGAFGSWWIGRRFARRIERINQASRAITQGDLSTRIPSDGRSDDLDELVAHWNEMLEQIETLMNGVRHVSDNIAHDLRTPLARLRNELEAARSAAEGGDAPWRSHLDRSIAEADGLLNTFTALLRIARIEAGERRAGFAAVDISRVVEDVVDLYEPVAEEQGQTLVRKIEPDTWVLGDRDLLFQAIANLVDNAVKYSPRNGEIQIDVQQQHGRGGTIARIAIADSGPGIPEESRDRVLERFVRLEKSRSTPGNGLGLALVAAVARLHGAVLELADNAPSPGLKVALQLPLIATAKD